jgi:hypothetical protein
MPIGREQFDAMGDDEERSTSERIIEFLHENRDQAFTRGEIADGVDRDPNTVGTNLSRLKQRGLVRHKDRYWAITDDPGRLADAVQFSEALSGLAERFGPLVTDESDAQAWADAQPERPHPSETDEGTPNPESDAVDAREQDG